jgi:glutathione S-transferase
MKLYFSPMACSLATRICLYEANAGADFVEVDPKTKRTADGRDFRTVNPLGYVPTLDIGEPQPLTENAAILQYVAAKFPQVFANDDAARLQQWLCFIGTELHNVVFQALLDANANAGAKEYALSKAPERLALLEGHLRDREFLLERFSVADAYLFTVLGWTVVTPIDLAPYPAVRAYLARVHRRPAVARAVGEERALYERELSRASASR